MFFVFEGMPEARSGFTRLGILKKKPCKSCDAVDKHVLEMFYVCGYCVLVDTVVL